MATQSSVLCITDYVSRKDYNKSWQVNVTAQMGVLSIGIEITENGNTAGEHIAQLKKKAVLDLIDFLQSQVKYL